MIDRYSNSGGAASVPMHCPVRQLCVDTSQWSNYQWSTAHWNLWKTNESKCKCSRSCPNVFLVLAVGGERLCPERAHDATCKWDMHAFMHSNYGTYHPRVCNFACQNHKNEPAGCPWFCLQKSNKSSAFFWLILIAIAQFCLPCCFITDRDLACTFVWQHKAIICATSKGGCDWAQPLQLIFSSALFPGLQSHPWMPAWKQLWILWHPMFSNVPPKSFRVLDPGGSQCQCTGKKGFVVCHGIQMWPSSHCEFP